VKTMSTDLHTTATHLDSLLAKADHGPGSVAKLMNDPGLYNDLRGGLQRLDSLMADFQKNREVHQALDLLRPIRVRLRATSYCVNGIRGM